MMTVPLTVPWASEAAAAAVAEENQRETTAPPVLAAVGGGGDGVVGSIFACGVTLGVGAGGGVVTAGALVAVVVSGFDDASGVFSSEEGGLFPAVPGVVGGAVVLAYPMPPQVCLLRFCFFWSVEV